MIRRFAQHAAVPVLSLLVVGLAMIVFVSGGLVAHVQRQAYFASSYYHPKVFSMPKDVHVPSPSVTAPVKVPILMYHYVEYVQDRRDTIRQGLDIIPRIFEKQIQTLIAADYTFITMDELADYLDGKGTLPPKPIILTFDDGYGDFYSDVLPLLVKYQIKAVAYIVPGFLDKLNYMTIKQLQEVAASGLVEIAAHTMHHVNLRSVNKDRARAEIDESKTALEALVGRPVHNFAYPYGDFNQTAVDLARLAGFRTAVSVIPGSIHSEQDRYFLYRLRPGARTGTALTSWLDGLKK